MKSVHVPVQQYKETWQSCLHSENITSVQHPTLVDDTLDAVVLFCEKRKVVVVPSIKTS